MSTKKVMFDGNTSAAYAAHATNEVCAIYPITPSSVMGELADQYSAQGRTNIWGRIPVVTELQSEGGASGAIHGSLTGGALSTTFTASQGLLLMVPNMYKIAGELAPTVFHVSARSISCQALSIFGDHSDIAAVRETGFGLVASGSPQEVMDNALAAQRCTMKSRVPMVQFFDGFRTSHEIQKIDQVPMEAMRAMIDEADVRAIRARALRPENPTMRGTAQNPDIYFQGRESVNKYYIECPAIMEEAYDRLFEQTGRRYHLFDYFGATDAETVMIIMGSGAEAAEEAVEYFVREQDAKYGLIKVRLYRPFSAEHLLKVLPKTAKHIVVMDRTKAPGATGEPLYLDVVDVVNTAVREGKYPTMPLIIGGRYGLSSKEFTPAMVEGCFKHIRGENPFHGFSVGINDDVTNLSISYDDTIDTEDPSCYRAKFWGLGSDGTVGASKNNIKVVGDNTDKYAQGFFVYDSKKAGGVTCSHLRFSDAPIKSTYLISRPDFVGIHAESFIGKIDLLRGIKKGGIVLVNTYIQPADLFNSMPKMMQEQILENELKLYCINAYEIVDKLGLPGRINTTMQGAFFKLSNVLPEETYRNAIEGAITKTFTPKGPKVVDINLQAFRAGIEQVVEAPVPDKITVSAPMQTRLQVLEDPVLAGFVEDVVDKVIAQEGDDVKVSQMPVDGAFPTDTSKYEKRSIAVRLPKWEPALCIQCNMCAVACPHAAIRVKISKESDIQLDTYETLPFKDKQAEADDRFRVQLYPDDCTGCGACISSCLGIEKDENKQPTGRRALNFVHKEELLEEARKTQLEFRRLPVTDHKFYKHTFKALQFQQPLLQFSGACAGCGETPYIRMVTQIVGQRMMQANATGCSSIWGGTAPTSPFARDKVTGCGPAWSSSLFEDNAEFGFGMRLAVDQLHDQAFALRDRLLADGKLPAEIKDRLGKFSTIEEQYSDESAITANMALAMELGEILQSSNGDNEDIANLKAYLPYFTKKSVWAVGGDGWAYDIGYGGLDHVIAQDSDINVLVLDTEVYSNTGGQKSKATPLGAIAQFASAGKRLAKKDLGLQAMSYRHAYVAALNLGANPSQAVKAFVEGEQYPGPALFICFAPCIAHGIDMSNTQAQSKAAQDSGYWINFRFDPRLMAAGKNPLQIDSPQPKITFREFAEGQNRFRRLKREYPDEYDQVMTDGERVVRQRHLYYQQLAAMDFSQFSEELKKAAE
ncbi:pyruvate:ferredoxin (flavodoxin) oxidoreductase [bacterium]|nr:pyruvate:ferredoxin (flavodoxin) oxidoreductase [bacterium]